MRTDKSVRWQEIKAAATGVAAGAGAYLIDGLPEPGSGLDDWMNYVTVPGYIGSSALVLGAIAHNKWYFSPHQRLLRDLGEDGWINPQDLRAYAGAAALYRQAGFLRPDLPEQGRLRRRPAPTEYGFCLGKLISGYRT